MKQTIINTYVIVSAILAIATTVMQVEPALYIINFLAPNPGEEFNMVFVLLVTFLIFLLPLVVYLIAARLIRKAPEEEISTDQTGIYITRQKAFSSAMVGIPIYVNDQKKITVDNGKTVFIERPGSTFTLQAGEGKQASEKLTVEINKGEQLKFELSINTDGLLAKMELTQVKE